RAGDRTGPRRAPGMTRLWPALLAVLALGACGKKAAPVNPALRVPVPVTDLRGEVHDGAVELAWTNPTRRADNTRLRDIVAARVYRTEDEGVGDPRPALLVRGRIAGYTELLTLTAMPGPPGAVTKPLLTGALVQVTDRQGLVDGGVENGRTYYYTVRAVRRAAGTIARGGVTPVVAASPVDRTPPPPPRDLVASTAGSSVQLQWSGPADAEVAGYVVYRAAAGRQFERVGSTTAPTTSFVDRDVPPGTYRYAVTTQDATARAIESARSGDVTVTVP